MWHVQCTLVTTHLLASLVQLFLLKAVDFPVVFLFSSISTCRISQSQSYWAYQTRSLRLFNCEPFRVIALLILTYLAQTVKPLSTMWETRVRSLGREDPLEKEMAIHSNTIAWKIPQTEEPGRQQSTGLQRIGHDWATSLHFNTPSKDFFFGIDDIFSIFISLKTTKHKRHRQFPIKTAQTDSSIDAHRQTNSPIG